LMEPPGFRVLIAKTHHFSTGCFVLCKKRALIINELAKKGIQTRPYYPNLSLAPQFKTDKRFPFSKKHSLESLFLPCGPSQPIENVQRTINELKSICEKI